MYGRHSSEAFLLDKLFKCKSNKKYSVPFSFKLSNSSFRFQVSHQEPNKIKYELHKKAIHK